MHRFPASLLLIAGVLATGASPALGQSSSSEDSASALVDQSTLLKAPELKGGLPSIKNGAIAPAVTELPPPLLPLKAPPSLALPYQNQQVSIDELRPLTLEDALLLAEVNLSLIHI